MLTRAQRIVNPLDFKRVVRRGRRIVGKLVIVHVAPVQGSAIVADAGPDCRKSGRAGFIVAKTIGHAVTRNRVKRRLRAIFATLMPLLQADVVVRALPGCASASYSDLESETRALLERAGIPA